MRAGIHRGVDLEHADLSGADLREVDLRGARLRGARLSGADLRDVDLTGADLRGVLGMWSGVRAGGATMDHCDVRDADLSGIDAPGLSLRAANLEGSRWDGADLRGATLTACRVGWRSIWLTESGSGRVVGASAWFDRACLAGADLSAAHLPGASMYGANLGGVVGHDAILTGANLIRADLRRADLTRADLCEADLREAGMTGVILRGASLVGARLIDTRLDGADVSGLRIGATMLGGPATSVADEPDVVNLAPNLSPGRPGPGSTCLVVADETSGSIRDGLVELMRQHGVMPYVATLADVASPTGPVTVARAFDAHPLTIVVSADGVPPGWLAVLRRSLIQAPAWVDRTLVHVTTHAPGLVAGLEIAGRTPAHLATTIAALRVSLAGAGPTTERLIHA